MQTHLSLLPISQTLSPSQQAEAVEAVAGAKRNGTPVYPLGGGTHLGYGALPAEPGLGLSLTRLDRVVDYPARDLTITVEAGITLATLAKRLAAEGQRLPVDVPWAERATVGGVVAVNAGGPRRYRWGTIREYVIGLTAIDGRGELFHAGGRVVKNAAGYDLCRLLTGSLGTLGVIVQVTLMVKPLPETSALVVCDVPDFPALERLLAGLVETRTLPSAIEFLAGPAWEQIPGLEPLAAQAVGRLAVGLEGTLGEVEWMISQLHQEWQRAGIVAAATFKGTRADPLWERLTQFRSPAEDGSSAWGLEIGVLPGELVAALQKLLAVEGASVAAHAGSGVIVVRGSAASPAGLAERLRGQLPGAALVVLDPPCVGRDVVWGPPRNGWAVMQGIKDRFDPQGILNRGRFVFADKKS